MKTFLPAFSLLLFIQTGFAQNWEVMDDVPLYLAFPAVVELNGYIHVIGGGAGQGAIDNHYRYDPVSNTWGTLADVPYLAQHPGAAMVNGKIHYCGGGYPNSGTPLNDHYIYDPGTDEWTQAADLPTARVIHEAVSLDGRLYVLTGQPDKQRFDYYDPTDDTWHQLNDLPDLNFWYGAIVATSATIYRFGGGGYAVPQDVAMEYDKVNDQWIALPDLPQALHAPAGAAINDQLICIAGGYNVSELAEVWLYNTATEEYTVSDALPEERSYHGLVLAGGCMYSVGGNHQGNDELQADLLKNCEIVATGIAALPIYNVRPYDIAFSPAGLQIQLHPDAMNEKAGIEVLDMQGRILISESLESTNGFFSIGAENLAAGMHLVMIVIGEKSYVENWWVRE